MIDDSITNMVAIVLTALFLGLLNSYQIAEERLPPGSLPKIELQKSGAVDSTGEGTQIGNATVKVQPGTLLTGAIAPLSAWVAKLGKDHKLVGRIWGPGQQEYLLPGDVVRAAAEADVVIVGETHDNPDHHKLQAWLLRELARKSKRPAVVMEMVSADKADDLAGAQLASNTTADAIANRLDWDQTGWGSFSLYKPIVDAALSAGFTMLPGDPAKDILKQVSQTGLGALAYSERLRLGLTSQFPAGLGTALADDLKSSHCNQLADNDVANMAQAQRYRDAILADNVLKAVDKANGGGAVLITGAGHARTDRGVPYYLRLRASGLKVVSIMLDEVRTGVDNPEDAIPRDPAGKSAADYVWYTARAERADPCLELQRQLQGTSPG